MNSFFGLQFDPNSLAGMSLALVLSVVLSGMIGFERQIHGHAAGLRTHILVCVGSTLITLVSIHIAGENGKGDPARMAAQIVSGIGFLGAGAIIREGASIKGLTTAASIWTTAGIGIAAGAGPFLGELATVATGIVLFTLWVLNYFEDKIDARAQRIRTIEVQVHSTERAAKVVLSKLVAHNLEVHSLEYSAGKDSHIKLMLMRVQVPKNFDLNAFVADLGDEPGVVSVST